MIATTAWSRPAPRSLRREEAHQLARDRMARCIRLERKYGRQLNEAGLQLVRRARFAAYVDMRATRPEEGNQ